MTYEVYVNGSAKFEGTLAECEKFAARYAEKGDEVQITRQEES